MTFLRNEALLRRGVVFILYVAHGGFLTFSKIEFKISNVYLQCSPLEELLLKMYTVNNAFCLLF